MLTNPQKSKIKQAQREAHLDDAEYRDALQVCCGVGSCTDHRLNDESFDKIMAYLEAIHWRKVDQGRIRPRNNHRAAFYQRGYWAAKNPKSNTSRDRYTRNDVAEKIIELESELAGLFREPGRYFEAVRYRVCGSDDSTPALIKYLGALKRIAKSKLHHA